MSEYGISGDEMATGAARMSERLRAIVGTSAPTLADQATGQSCYLHHWTETTQPGDPGRTFRCARCPITISAPRGALPEYDPEAGEVITERYPDGLVREAARVRAQLADAVFLAAIVAELERRGYTVTPPPAP